MSRNIGLTYEFTELDAAMERGGWTQKEVGRLCSEDNLAAALLVVRGEAAIVRKQQAAKGQGVAQ